MGENGHRERNDRNTPARFSLCLDQSDVTNLVVVLLTRFELPHTQKLIVNLTVNY